MEQQFVKLTNELYKLLEFFPESDPLKNRAKDRALLIMENLKYIHQIDGWASFQSEKIKTHVLEDIDTLLGYLWIAKSQGWLNSVNYLIVANEYNKVAKDLKPFHVEFSGQMPYIKAQKNITESVESNVLAKEEVNNLFDDRQRKIMEFLKANEKAQVMDLKTVLPNVTKRTIRRDLDELMAKGQIERFGEFNEVFYKIKR